MAELVTDLIAFGEMVGTVLSIWFFCWGGFTFLRDGWSVIPFFMSDEYHLAKNEWDAKEIATKAVRREAEGLEATR